MALENEIAELKKLIAKHLSEIEVLKAENAALRSENAELRARLNLNSQNSHKPPSSDGLGKKSDSPKTGLPKPPAKKSGGQEGHSGHTLKMVEKPDRVVVHHAAQCPKCSKVFSQTDVVATAGKRQVFDIPEPRMEVTEHQLGVVECCGCQHVGAFPVEVAQPVQYGSRIKALSVMLNNDYKVPLDKIEQLMRDLWGGSFNTSTVVNANAGMDAALLPVEQTIKAAILASQVAHFDETGMRVEKSLYWCHVASTRLFTHLFIHKKRGKEALSSADSVLHEFRHRAVHDCWVSYFDFDQCKHALCGAHLLRELTALIEQDSKWAKQMHELVMALYEASKGTSEVVPDQAHWHDKFKHICDLADKEEAPPSVNVRGKPKQSKGRNLLNRLIKYRDLWLAFAFEPDVPFSNNQAERDIRCLKTKQKVATNFQTLKGAQHYARIQSFVSTLRKHSMNVFSALARIFDRQSVVFQAA